VTLKVDVYAWYIAAPLVQFTPIEGSPALCASPRLSGAASLRKPGAGAVLGAGSAGFVTSFAVPVMLSPSGANGTTRTV
jgi:hypothetical protein